MYVCNSNNAPPEDDDRLSAGVIKIVVETRLFVGQFEGHMFIRDTPRLLDSSPSSLLGTSQCNAFLNGELQGQSQPLDIIK